MINCETSPPPLPIAVLEEIGLEGLEGITLEGLWKRLSIRLKLELPLNENYCKQIWDFLLKQNNLQFYELPVKREALRVIDRRELIDPEIGITQEPAICPYTLYKYNPISIGKIRGSCEHYNTRIEIQKELLQSMKLTLTEVENKWDRKLIIVASQALRESLLIPLTINGSADIKLIQYCILERIGRSRHMGEITIGKFSLQDIVKEATTCYYHRKHLLKLKLIVKQAYHQKVGDQHCYGSLLHLPQYYIDIKPKSMILTEKVVEILKQKHNCMAEYDEIKAEIGTKVKDSVKKLFKSNDFKKFVNTDLKVPYRSLYPNAKEREWKLKNKDEEKSIRVVQLIDPNIDLSEMWFKDEDNEDEEGLLDLSDNLVGVPLIRQTYNFLQEAKENGLSQMELVQKIGHNKLNARGFLHNLIRLKIAKSYMKDKGRQRMAKYVVTEHIEKAQSEMNEEKTAISNSFINIKASMSDNLIVEQPNNSVCDNNLFQLNSTITPIENLETSDFNELIKDNEIGEDKVEIKLVQSDTIPGIKRQKSGIAELIESKNFNTSNGHFSYRMLKRTNIILQTVRTNLVIDDNTKLLKIISQEEIRLGYKDKICKKSLLRILCKLAIDKYVKFFLVIIKSGINSRTLAFTCDPSVDSNHTILRSCLEQLKLRFILSNKSSKVQKIQNDKPEILPKKINKDKLGTENSNYGFCPKFIRMRVLHEYLFYLIYSLPENTKKIKKDDAIESWKSIHANINYDEIKSELSDIYSTNIDWKIFIQPLREHQDFTTGWALMSDVLLRLPLSIFVKIFNITFEIPELDEILTHPIRKHYLLKYIPLTLRENLIKSRKYVFSIDEIARRLCFVGLLQFGPQRLKERDKVFVYLNRKASLYNTITSDPGYYQISKKEYEVINYDFNCLSDVEKYWHDLWSICLNTRLGKRKSIPIGTHVVYELLHVKPCMLETVEPQTIESALEKDNGTLPGDKLGAAGLDSAFFAHLKRNWNWQCIKKKVTTVKPTVRKRKLESIKSIPIQFKRYLKDTHLDKAGCSKSEKRIVTPIPKKILPKKSRKIFIRQKTEKNTLRIRQPFYDDVDKRALTLMSKLRVEWSTAEDNILLLCKVGMFYLATRKQKTVTYTVIRDILHWSLKSMNKTSRACQRRIVYMIKNQATMNNVYLCLEEVRENKEIKKKFGPNFFTELKKYYTDDEEFLRALTIHFIDLIILLKKYFGKLSSNCNDFEYILLPDTLQEFHKHFKESVSDYSVQLLYNDPLNRNEIELNTVYLLIHGSMCCAKDKSSYGVQLFDIYKNYQEKLLSEAMKKIRLDQLLSMNKNATKKEADPDKCLPLNAHPYHLSITFQIQISTKISYEIFEETYCRFYEILNSNYKNDAICVSNTELTTTDPGTCILLGELLSLQTIEINIEAPKRILMLDPVKEKEDPLYERISNRFHEIFSVMPKMTIDENETENKIDNTSSICVPNLNNKKVNFAEKNEKICYNLHPIENLLKFKDHHFHFFCLLNSIGTNLHPQTFAINDNNICSTDCVLNRSDFIEFVLDCVKSKRDVLFNIKSGKNNLRIDFVRVKEDNLIDVYQKLIERSDSFKKDQSLKDIGKINDSICLPSLNILDVVKEISEKISNSNEMCSWLKDCWKIENEELEESIIPRASELKENIGSKEDFSEKIRRLHEFFVVNSSKIHIKLNQNLDKNSLIKINNIKVPESIIPWNVEKNDNLIKKIQQKHIWPPFQRNDSAFHFKMKENNFSNVEIITGINVLCFIEQNKELGATTNMLIEKFNDILLLQKITNLLVDLNFILKSGIKTVTYIYWLYIQPWIVNTYHIYRLEKESIEPKSSRIMPLKSGTSKRRGDSMEDKLTTKKTKTDYEEASTSQSPALQTPTADNIQNDSKIRNREIIQIRPSPWIRVNGSLNRRVLDRWLGAILLYCISSPGSSLLQISLKFKFLHPVLIRNLLDILKEIGSVTMYSIRKKPVTMFSVYENIAIEPATDFDAKHSTFVEATSSAVVRLSLFIGNKKYKSDFF